MFDDLIPPKKRCISCGRLFSGRYCPHCNPSEDEDDKNSKGDQKS